MTRLCALAGTAALSGLLATPAQAAPIFDQQNTTDPVASGGGLPTPVATDEPVSLVMLGSGLMMLVFVMKRQTIRR